MSFNREEKDLRRMYEHAVNYVSSDLGPRCEVIMSEVAISVNWTEGKAEILEGVTGREYPHRKGWQNGTADLVCILKTGELLIADWKTGGTDGSTEQLLSLACGLSKVLLDTGVTEGSQVEPTPRPVRIACLKVDNDGVRADEVAVSQERLSNHWFSMEMAWADKDKKREAVPGIHCTQLYCPHLAYCSKITEVVDAGAKEDGLQPMGSETLIPPGSLVRNSKMTDTPRSDEEAGYTMARVAASRRQMKYYETAMKEYIAKGGRVINGNYEWKERNNGFRWGRIGS